MGPINKLEATIATWYKDAPHLPKEGQKWLAQNIWWLTLVGVILGILGIASLIFATLLAGAVLVGFGGAVGAALGGIALVAVFVSVALSVVTIVLGAMAITPLKGLQKKGWILLFVIGLLNVAAQVISFLFYYNVFTLIWGLVLALVGIYFLFEIREYYGSEKNVRKVQTHPIVKKRSS